MLDPDAKVAADSLSSILPAPIYTLGVAKARELLDTPSGKVPLTAVREVKNVTIPADSHDITVRIYRPCDADKLPALVYIHGGGWTIGGLDGADELCRALATKTNCVVVSVEYRLAPEYPFPAGLDDCVTAFNWVAHTTSELGVDPSRIAIGGDSAGANLAIAVCQLAMRTDDPLPCFQLLAYPPTNFESQRPSWTEHANAPLLTAADARWFMSLYLSDENDTTNPLVSPEKAPSLAGLPPAHIITADVDVLRDDSEAFAEQLRNADVNATITRYPGVFHGFFTEVGTYARTAQAIDEAAERLVEAWSITIDTESNP
ncbi:acetyl esterase [Rhodococcus sp. SMB37]|uniref:alpha/beta hydrolase n=1 Tax=Rhodococcus sp. SMB37 TaxID=2512213 RepID=UPI00104B6B8A|nr:alpha/beta hydrolase [Rhodococcus sp. SMB37]TCN53383.1 acetyl esterase [Rhodococcus sp. SMB37]